MQHWPDVALAAAKNAATVNCTIWLPGTLPTVAWLISECWGLCDLACSSPVAAASAEHQGSPTAIDGDVRVMHPAAASRWRPLCASSLDEVDVLLVAAQTGSPEPP